MSVVFSTSVSSPVKWTQKHCLLLRPADQVCLGSPGTGSRQPTPLVVPAALQFVTRKICPS